MTRDEINTFIEGSISDEDTVLLADGLDEAFLGLSQEDGDKPRAVYSIERCIKVLSAEMPEDEATEYFWFNVAGAKGEEHPLFINTPDYPQDISWTVNSSYLD
jgi:hypothetical protein